MTIKKTLTFKIIAVLGVVAAIFGAISFSSQAAKKDTTPPPQAVVVTEAAKSKELFDSITYPARLFPKISAAVLAESDGMVTRILAPLGTTVAKRAQILFLKNTDPIYDYTPFAVTAPVRGVVSSMEVSEGSLVAKGQKLLTVTDPASLKISIEITAKDMAHIRPGTEGELTVPTHDKPVKVKVQGVSPYVDPGTGTASAELIFADPTPPLSSPPGIVGQVTFKANIRKGIEILESSVVYKGDKTLVRLLDGNKVKYQDIALGKMRENFIEIASGLTEGQTFVVRSSRYVADGEEVRVETVTP